MTLTLQLEMKRMFRVFGHERIWVLDGGLPAWRASGFDVESSASGDSILKASAASEAIEKVYQRQAVSFPLLPIPLFEIYLNWKYYHLNVPHSLLNTILYTIQGKKVSIDKRIKIFNRGGICSRNFLVLHLLLNIFFFFDQ